MNIICYGSVDCFGLISGWVLSDIPFKYSRLVHIWLQAVFICVISVIAFSIFSPDSLSLKNWIDVFIPVISGQYWYVTAYVGMYFFIPFINKSLDALTIRSLILYSFVLWVVMSLLPHFRMTDPWRLGGGASLLWLLTLYIIGASLKRICAIITIKNLSLYMISLFVICVIFTWCSKIIIDILAAKYNFSNNLSYWLISYRSPTVSLSAVALLILFTRVKIAATIRPVICLCSSLSLGIYLFHTYPLTFEKLLAFTGKYIYCHNIFSCIFSVLGCAAVIYIVCGILEYGRQKIFKIFTALIHKSYWFSIMDIKR